MKGEQASSLSPVRVYVLGPLEVARRETSGNWQTIPKNAWGKYGKAGRRILGRLLAAPGRRAGQGRLMDDLWPNTDSKGNLDNGLTAIRAVIGKDLIETIDTIFYQVVGQTLVWVDVDACAMLLKEAENQGRTTEQAIPLLEEALLYLERGEYLEGEEGIWCHSLRKKPEDMLRQCRFWLAQGYEQQGKTWQAGEQYRALCQLLPPDEHALQAWMGLLVRQSKWQDALRRYQEIRDYCDVQGFPLSPLTHHFATRIEQQCREETLSTMISVPLHQAVTPWSFPWLEGIELASSREIMYDDLETEVMTTALQWKQAMYSIVMLQQFVHAIIRRYDAMREDPDHYEKVTRRYALQTIAQFPIQMYGLAFLLSDLQTLPPSEEFLPLCAAGLTACLELRQYEQPEGWITIRRVLAAYLPTLEKLAQQSSPTKQAAAHLAAQGHLLVHMLADHYGKLEHMESAARRARFYGQLANDPNLEVSALIRLAVRFDYEHQYQKALAIYEEALALPDLSRVSPLLQGRLYGGLAGMYGHCQQTRQALAFLDRAKEVYPGTLESDPSFAFAYCGRYTLDLGEGLALEHTEQYSRAIDVYLRYLPELQEQRRAAGHLTKAAVVAIKQRDLDAAFSYLDSAEEEAWDTQQKQRLTEVQDTLMGMRLIWANEPKVKMLQERLNERKHA